MSGVLCVAGPWRLLDQKAQPWSVPVVQVLPPGAPQSCPGVWLQAPWLTAWVGGLPESPLPPRPGAEHLKKAFEFLKMYNVSCRLIIDFLC